MTGIIVHLQHITRMSALRRFRIMVSLLPILAGAHVSAFVSKTLAPSMCHGSTESNHVGANASITKVIHIDMALDDVSLKNIIAGAEHKYSGLPVFVLFTAEKCDGISWCGDSNRAEPILIPTIERYRPNCVLIVCAVKRNEYKDKSYVYKTSPIINLRCVPTLQR